MKKIYLLLPFIFYSRVIFTNSFSKAQPKHAANEVFTHPSAILGATLIYKAAQDYFSGAQPFSSNKELQAHMLSMPAHEWKAFIETTLLDGTSIESLIFTEKQKLFSKFELYQYDGYRLLMAAQPEFKNYVLGNSRSPSRELEAYRKKSLLYSKKNLELIRKYYNGEITISERKINALPDILTGDLVESIIGKPLPRTLGHFINEENYYRTNFSGRFDPRQTPLGLSHQQLQELAHNIKNNFHGFQSNVPNPQTAPIQNIPVVHTLSQDTLQMCEEKNIDAQAIALSQGTYEQNLLHKQFVDIINKSANIYVRYENYSEVKKLALGATRYSIAGISLTKSNNLPLAQFAYRAANSILAFLEGAREACGDKVTQVYRAVKNPVQFGQDLVNLALNASSEIALFTTQALNDPKVQKTIATILADPHPSFEINSMIATKACAELDAYMRTHTAEQAAHTLGKEVTNLILDTVLLQGAGKALKTAKITQKLGYVGKQASRLVGYSIVNTPESIERAAQILAEISPEALAANPIINIVVTGEVECAKAIKEIGFKALPKTLSPIVEELIASNRLPKSFIPSSNSLTLALQENGIYELNKTADIFGNNWKKIAVAGEEFWQITPASANGRNFLLQMETDLIQSPEAFLSNNQIIPIQSPVFTPLIKPISTATQDAAPLIKKIETAQARYQILKTGEKCRIPYPEDGYTREMVWGPKKYEEIRALKDDIQIIAQNTNIPIHKIQRIKNHLFYDEHILRDEVRRFDPNTDIAAAWDRLYKGDFVKNDIQLLEHEYFESKFERLFKTDYDTAHAAAQKVNGQPWYENS